MIDFAGNRWIRISSLSGKMPPKLSPRDCGISGYEPYMALAQTFDILKKTYAAFSSDKAPRLAAALAYSTVFSIAPLFIIAIAIVGGILGATSGGHAHHIVEDSLINQIRSRAGEKAAESIRTLITASFSKTSASVVAQIIGWITFVLGASGVFAALQDALNTVWAVETPAGRSIWIAVRERVASLGMVLAIGFLLLVSFILDAGLAIVSSSLTRFLPFAGAGLLFQLINIVVSGGIITLLFAMIFKILPDAKIDWSDVWTGAGITAALFVVGQYAISFYLAKTGAASAYGAAGALLVLLLWIYYSALILLFGAEFTKVYALMRGKAIQPASNAVIARPAATPTPTAVQ